MAHEHTPPQKPDDGFDALVAGFGSPSIESQQELLGEVHAQHLAAWRGLGIIDKVQAQVETVVNDIRVGLTKVVEDGPKGSPVEVHGLTVPYLKTVEIDPEYRTTQEFTRLVEISRTLDGKRTVLPPFGKIHADIIASQVAELEALRDNGDLPNISPELNGIADPWKQSD
jgi:hypothetical protein